jgi:hypothetical protein
MNAIELATLPMLRETMLFWRGTGLRCLTPASKPSRKHVYRRHPSPVPAGKDYRGGATHGPTPP